MDRMVGTVVRGIRCPIIQQGDAIEEIVVNSLLQASAEAGFEFRDRDIVSITESVVARAQGNYATVDQIAQDVRSKFSDEPLGVLFPMKPQPVRR